MVSQPSTSLEQIPIRMLFFFHLLILHVIAKFLVLSDVSKLISTLFHSQVFLSGFVHSDPHPANVMVRKHPQKRGKPQLVLVDHGLYKEIDNGFRILYAHLYKSLLLADVPAIQATCEKLGITKMVRIHPLLLDCTVISFVNSIPHAYCCVNLLFFLFIASVYITVSYANKPAI